MPVFYATSRVEIFQLADYLGFKALARVEIRELQQGSVADKVGQLSCYSCHIQMNFVVSGFFYLYDKDSGWIVYGIYHKPGIFLPPSMRHAQKEVTIIIIYKSERTIFNVCLLLMLGRGSRWLEARRNDPLLGRAGR